MQHKNIGGMMEETKDIENQVKPAKSPWAWLIRIVVGVFVILLVLYGYGLAKIKTPKNDQTETVTTKISISGTGFSPTTAKIKKGSDVVWTNTDSAAVHRVAGDPFPSAADNEFDSKHNLSQGGTFTKRFDQAGTFKYHDEKNPALTGEIIVE